MTSPLSSEQILPHDVVAQPGEKRLTRTVEPLDPVLSEAEGYVTSWCQPADKRDILHLNAWQYGESELAESDYFDRLYEDN
ncbi:MAG: hypothetical protein OEW09_16735, partial [Anaerolineae bacterium]|nr:hypothetical protein [Anaerolineae bacterium]